MMKNRFYLLTLMLLALQIAPANAKPPYACPQRIALVEGNHISQIAHLIIQKAYKALGCETNFIKLPGKRGTLEFNHGKVDGELMRLEIVEELYTAPFIKSAHPLFYLPRSLWVNPSAHTQSIAYLLGVIWQRDYMSGKENAISFHSYDILFKAYNKGSVTAFLANDIAVQIKINKGELKPVPYIKKSMPKAPIYHYLSPDFKDFSAAFSNYIARHKSFENLKQASH